MRPGGAQVTLAILGQVSGSARREVTVTRQVRLSRTFVELADTLVENYDQIEFLHRLAERYVSLLGVAEAGVVPVGAEGQLRPLPSSSERMHLIELIQLQCQDGERWHIGAVGGLETEDGSPQAALIV